MRLWLPLLLATAVSSSCEGTQGAPDPHRGPRVLFIGNSLTYTNDLPGLVQQLAHATGGEPLVVSSVTVPNYSLEDHWNTGDAARAIAAGGWDVIVLQQGPSSLDESRVLLVEYAKRFAAEARKVHARVALYSVWPSNDRLAYFDAVTGSYAAAADSTGGLLYPVGEAWRAAWRRDAGLTLYGTDGFHPSQLGTALAAVVIYSQLTGHDLQALPTSLDWPGGHVALSPQLSNLLLTAAAEANHQFQRP
jgi:hypothetical protein